MSFILDALKKSETERQRQNAPGFVDVPDGADPPRAPRWLWVLGGLLAINLIVVSGMMLRPDPRPATDATATDEAIPNEGQPEREASFSEMVEQAKNAQPPQVADGTTAEKSTGDAPVAEASPLSNPKPTAMITESYATFNDLRANGTLLLPDLHLDIHVYSDQPAERFVFVNMNKYREQARLAEGPLVKEITPEGVILEHLGNSFLLPRE
ncbi:MAG: general secretion pathway protein GspB [Woeseiaceae bacterium]